MNPFFESLENRQHFSTSHLGHKAASQFYLETDLASDTVIHRAFFDNKLVNPYGLAAGSSGAWFVADAGSGTSTSYLASGRPTPSDNPLRLRFVKPGRKNVLPVAVVANPSDNDFNVLRSSGFTSPAQFLFSSTDGRIFAYTGGRAVVQVIDNRSQSARYTGLAIASVGPETTLVAADFHNGRIDLYDGNFNKLDSSNAFIDDNLPDGYAPYNVVNINGDIFVTYALQDSKKVNPVAGPGNGYIDQFDANGELIGRFASGGFLNAPYGLAVAPSNFGKFSNSLLVANSGEGRILAYNLSTGAFQGRLQNSDGSWVIIKGIHGLSFGNDSSAGASNALFFTAGTSNGAHGLFGRLTAVFA